MKWVKCRTKANISTNTHTIWFPSPAAFKLEWMRILDRTYRMDWNISWWLPAVIDHAFHGMSQYARVKRGVWLTIHGFTCAESGFQNNVFCQNDSTWSKICEYMQNKPYKTKLWMSLPNRSGYFFFKHQQCMHLYIKHERSKVTTLSFCIKLECLWLFFFSWTTCTRRQTRKQTSTG